MRNIKIELKFQKKKIWKIMFKLYNKELEINEWKKKIKIILEKSPEK